jgi:hypothetical protein
MLTLAEAARRNALEVVGPDNLTRWRAEMKAKCIAFIEAEFNKTPFAQIGDLDHKPLENNLDDGLADATYELSRELF